jgi:hypothetical protein
MYLDILNDDMVGFDNSSAGEMMSYVFTTYGSITAVDLDHNFDTMCKARDPHQPIETLFEWIQDFVDFSEAGGVTIGAAHQISAAYTKVFATCSIMSACCRWNEKEDADRTCNNFKMHVAAEYHQYKQMQGESVTTSEYHAANTAVAQSEDEMVEGIIGAIANLETAAASDRGVVTALIEAN